MEFFYILAFCVWAICGFYLVAEIQGRREGPVDHTIFAIILSVYSAGVVYGLWTFLWFVLGMWGVTR